MSVYVFAQKRGLCIQFLYLTLFNVTQHWDKHRWYNFVTMVNYDPLDIELGGLRNLSNQQHWMVKGFLYVAQEIPEKLIHFPLILICLFLFSSSNPGILSEYSCIVISLIVSCLMSFVIYSIKSLCSIFRKSEDKFKSGSL